MRIALVVVASLLPLLAVASGFDFEDPEKLNANIVPDEATAIRIAEAVLIPLHGQQQVEAQRPYVVKSPTKEYWVVYGSSRQLGGGFFVAIKKKSGCVTRIGFAK
ncbi:MAG: NTF2 fold immunity protein [Candidatus Acidiferrales bacterium]